MQTSKFAYVANRNKVDTEAAAAPSRSASKERNPPSEAQIQKVLKEAAQKVMEPIDEQKAAAPAAEEEEVNFDDPDLDKTGAALDAANKAAAAAVLAASKKAAAMDTAPDSKKPEANGAAHEEEEEKKPAAKAKAKAKSKNKSSSKKSSKKGAENNMDESKDEKAPAEAEAEPSLARRAVRAVANLLQPARAPSPPPVGQGKGKTAMKRPAKRHAKVLRDNIQGVTKKSIQRLARRGGVLRISGGIYEETRGVLKSHFLPNIIRSACTLAESARRKTITIEDVLYALQLNGRPMYGKFAPGEHVKGFTGTYKKKVPKPPGGPSEESTKTSS